MIVLTAFVSPFRADRDKARALVADGDFLEIHCAADLAGCVNPATPRASMPRPALDRSRSSPGISSPYEAPEKPELCLDTGAQDLEQCVAAVINLLEERGVLKAAA